MTQPDPADIHTVLVRVARLRARAARDRAGLHYVEGIRAVLQAFDAAIPIEIILYSEILVSVPHAQKRVRLLKRDGTRVVRVTPEQFRSVSQTPHASGLGVIVRQHWTPLDRIDPRRGLCRIAVSSVRSPGNLGTLVRTAEAVGAGGVIFLGDAADPFDPAVVRASMGGLFHLELTRATTEEFAAWAGRHACRVVGTSPSAAAAYTDAPVDPPLVILFGDERAGLSMEERALCTHMASIPIVGRADSLNVGVAAGVMLYEVLRRQAQFLAGAPPRC